MSPPDSCFSNRYGSTDTVQPIQISTSAQHAADGATGSAQGQQPPAALGAPPQTTEHDADDAGEADKADEATGGDNQGDQNPVDDFLEDEDVDEEEAGDGKDDEEEDEDQDLDDLLADAQFEGQMASKVGISYRYKERKRYGGSLVFQPIQTLILFLYLRECLTPKSKHLWLITGPGGISNRSIMHRWMQRMQ